MAVDRWSVKYDFCQVCLSDTRPHQCRGLCKPCHELARQRLAAGSDIMRPLTITDVLVKIGKRHLWGTLVGFPYLEDEEWVCDVVMTSPKVHEGIPLGILEIQCQ